nr:MAG TPA: hypothetical protein [Caudoviricetes sp.]
MSITARRAFSYAKTLMNSSGGIGANSFGVFFLPLFLVQNAGRFTVPGQT